MRAPIAYTFLNTKRTDTALRFPGEFPSSAHPLVTTGLFKTRIARVRGFRAFFQFAAWTGRLRVRNRTRVRNLQPRTDKLCMQSNHAVGECAFTWHSAKSGASAGGLCAIIYRVDRECGRREEDTGMKTTNFAK